MACPATRVADGLSLRIGLFLFALAAAFAAFLVLASACAFALARLAEGTDVHGIIVFLLAPLARLVVDHTARLAVAHDLFAQEQVRCKASGIHLAMSLEILRQQGLEGGHLDVLGQLVRLSSSVAS